MIVTITKPDGEVYNGEASLVHLPGIGGQFEILQNHAPIVSALARGTIRLIDADGETHTIDIRGGVVQCQDNNVTILIQ